MPRTMHPERGLEPSMKRDSRRGSDSPPSDRARERVAASRDAVGHWRSAPRAAGRPGTGDERWPKDRAGARSRKSVRITTRPSRTPLNGTFDGLTVNLQRLDLGGLLVHVLTRDPSTLVPVDAVEPPDVAPSVYDAYEKAAFVDGGQIAAAVAERALGYQVSVATDGLEVFAVAKGSPAAGTLEVGDVISAVDGTTISTAAALSNVVEAAHGGRASFRHEPRHQPYGLYPRCLSRDRPRRHLVGS